MKTGGMAQYTNLSNQYQYIVDACFQAAHMVHCSSIWSRMLMKSDGGYYALSELRE